MAQRVTLAQTQLQLAQADPASHNMYEAYRRMYQALGVKDIDVLFSYLFLHNLNQWILATVENQAL